MILSTNVTGSREAEKISFALSDEEAGPFPVSSESLWCIPEGGNYRIKNIPFFLESVSFDDLVSVIAVDEGRYRISETIETSQNSTLWVSVLNEDRGQTAINALHSLGCGVESGVFEQYFAINVPSIVRINEVFAVLDPAVENNWLMVDYPSLRHKVEP